MVIYSLAAAQQQQQQALQQSSSSYTNDLIFAWNVCHTVTYFHCSHSY